MTPTEGQTTTPSCDDLLSVKAVLTVLVATEFAATNGKLSPIQIELLSRAQDAVAVLIARNAELEAERNDIAHVFLTKQAGYRREIDELLARNAELEAQTPSALREKLRSCEEALQAVEADRDALAGERDALRNDLENAWAEADALRS